MLGAIAGDIIGSVYEFNNHKTKAFPLFGTNNLFTDDTVLTIAIADAIRNAVSVGGDTDTLTCICGGIAEAFYGSVPTAIAQKTLARLDPALRTVTENFRQTYGCIY